jgi:inosine/xanthosine triphosphate pyrophosphatase family protein
LRRCAGWRPGHLFGALGGPTKDFRIAMNRIHDELRHKGLSTSAAKFVCALCVALPWRRIPDL